MAVDTATAIPVNTGESNADWEANMKRLWLASVGFTALTAGAALAADIPPARYVPPARAPAYVPFFSWNGFYLGINAGYGWGDSKWTDNVTAATTGNFDTSGAVIGGTAGYNLQTGSMVFGVETDFDWSNIKGTTVVGCPAPGCETTNEWLGTARARLGYAIDRALPYVTGGLAYGQVKGTVPGVGSFSDTSIGWTAGGGFEYAFAGNWSAKLEYLYVDLGAATCNAACSGGNPFDVEFTAHLLRGGLNYKF
jgi:outer membrane immunogenic protein